MGTMDDRPSRYAAYTARLVDAVLTQPGHTPPELRRAIVARAGGRAAFPLSTSVERGSGGEDPLSGTERGTGDEDRDLAAYVDKVAKHAYKVTDDDLGRLQQAGHSDDALFEVTVSAALGAALARLERGLAVLRSHPLVPPLHGRGEGGRGGG